MRWGVRGICACFFFTFILSYRIVSIFLAPETVQLCRCSLNLLNFHLKNQTFFSVFFLFTLNCRQIVDACTVQHMDIVCILSLFCFRRLFLWSTTQLAHITIEFHFVVFLTQRTRINSLTRRMLFLNSINVLFFWEFYFTKKEN